MKIKTGQGTISLITLIGIWSISALTSLPGLAVSPILGELSVLFPQASDLEIQMLSSLPSLLIIPFVLLAGSWTEKHGFMRVLKTGLWLFAASGVLYLVADRMWQLVAISALLGIGAGMIIPLSTGLISHYFTGTYRVKQFGLSSAITNITLVVATAATGYLAEVNWHLPFIVYLLPLLSILLSGYIQKDMSEATTATTATPLQEEPAGTLTDKMYMRYGIHVRNLIQLMLFYGLVTYLILVLVFNLPFLMEAHHFSAANSGLMISLFFLAIMLPGLLLDKIIRYLGERTVLYSLLSIAVGLVLIWASPIEWLIVPGCMLTGLGYGIIQPFIYNKTTQIAIPPKTTLALAFVMAMNYLAILLCPFIIDLFQAVFRTQSQEFPFLLNVIFTLAAVLWAYLRRGTFLFEVKLSDS